MLQLAFSPCPNDTFLFYAWVNALVGKSMPVQVTLADIEALNSYALQRRFPLLKVSVSCYKKIRSEYNLLSMGAALGYGVGPKIVARKPTTLDNLLGKKVALPGKETSAHALFSHFFPHFHDKLFCSYDQVLPLLKSGAADVGVIIHETRFTFAEEGYYEVVDLGSLWEKKYALPLPLGCLVVHKSISEPEKIDEILEESLAYANTHATEALEWSRNFSQEKRIDIIEKHIRLYLSQGRITLEGMQAIQLFLEI